MTKIYIEGQQTPPTQKRGRGQPTKLTPELIEKADTYLDTCFDTPIFTDKGALAYAEVNLPSIEGLAIHLDIRRATVYDWCKGGEFETEAEKAIREDFSYIVDRVRREQAKRLINNGVGGLYQAKVAGMILSRHGYAEKTETDLTTGGDKLGQSTVLPDLVKAAEELLKQRKLSKPDQK